MVYFRNWAMSGRRSSTFSRHKYFELHIAAYNKNGEATYGEAAKGDVKYGEYGEATYGDAANGEATYGALT